MENVFLARTVQTNNIKTLFEVLKEIVVDVSLVITKDSIRIMYVNDNETSCMVVKLEPSEFDEFHCDHTEENPLVLGIHTNSLFKIIKTIKYDETISLFVTTENRHVLNVRKEVSKRNFVNTFKIDLLEIPHQIFEVPKLEFSTVVNINSNEFQKICKDYHSLGSPYLEIKNTNNHLYFNGKGDFCSFEGSFGNSENTNIESGEVGNIVQGKYEIKHLLLFSKSASLSTSMEIFMGNDMPLVLSYQVGTLGNIRFILSPI